VFFVVGVSVATISLMVVSYFLGKLCLQRESNGKIWDASGASGASPWQRVPVAEMEL
tara:strand:+ start:312 stop:482 length:171 start_codon:yes stop_codon:yes gene_type:complete